MNRDSRIYVAGHHGLVGSAIARKLERDGYRNLVVCSRKELDLRDAYAVQRFFAAERPEYVFLAAARVGGILANDTYPADFIRDNLAIELNVIDTAYRARVQKLLFLGSSCIYPRNAPQPMREEHLLTGTLEPTNEPYAIAKIAGVKLCQAYHRQHGSRFISLMPTNIYGPGDNFDLHTSHVLPALIRKFAEARAYEHPRVVVWGSGTPRREFLHVDDLADACVFLMQSYEDPDIINVGTGSDVSIAELAQLIARATGFSGEIVYDAFKPDGTPRKLLDVSRLTNLGWKASIPLESGIQSTVEWFRQNYIDQSHSEILESLSS